ncbi:MAG: hypothetical protein JXB88_06365 [Spirochaetales bacterium]|nr:hypothetical protein [Spirochaetales bacterium]
MNYVVDIAIILAGFVILYLILKRKIEKSINPRALIDEIRVEVDRIIVELNNTTERNISLIEDRMNQLSGLLEKADKKILLLNREIEKYEVSKNYSNILQKAKKSDVSDKKETEETDIKEKVLKFHREGFSPAVIANHTGLPVGEVELIISLTER